MKFLEVAGGFSIPVSNEEMALVNRIKENAELSSADLSEREREMARLLVTRGVLNRVKINETTHYVFNSLNDVWRDQDA